MSDTAHLLRICLRAPARLLLVAMVASALAVTATSAPAEAVVRRTTYAQSAPVYLGSLGENLQNDPVVIPDSGPAASYPSTLPFTHPARVTDVDIRFGLSHTRPDNLEVRLVGPGGQQVVLMSHVGGDADVAFSEYIVFDDDADAPIPVAGPITPGDLVKPAQALSVFNGTDAAGDWKLYVDDDVSADSGLFGWRLDLELATSPYPSELVVSNAGTVTDVNVTLDNVTAPLPAEMDLLLVGPHGQQATLMSDVAGGSNELVDVDITLDDEAPDPLPDEEPITAGSFQPTNVNVADIYPAPAPAPTGATALSVFDGTTANGTWRLFAWDQSAGDLAELSGWSLDIESDDSAAPTGSVTVAGGASVVTSRAVTLGLSATDALSGVTRMRFSNDGFTFSPWQAYAATAAWTLAPGPDGTRTVYAQFDDAFANASAVVTDTITLDTTSLDTTGPSVKKIAPGKNATGVAKTVKIKITLSEAVDKKSVSKKSVKFKKGNATIKAKIKAKGKGKKIVLTPNSPLAKGSYTVTVTSKVKDKAGNAFDAKPKKKGSQSFTSGFTV